MVDDDQVTRQFMSDTLRSARYDVYACDDGEQALVSFARHAPFAVVVVDVLLPGMRGTQLAEMLARTAPDVRILYVSSRTNAPPLAPRRLFLKKPFSAQTFLAEIEKVVGSAGAP